MNNKIRKIAIIGTGNVGSHVGFNLAIQGEVDELAFIDINKNKAEGEALDLADAVSFLPNRVRVWAGDIKDCADSDIVVISAGPLPRADQSRLDTLGDTINVLKDTLPQIVETGFGGIFICISNPADVIADYVRKRTGFPKERVFSTGTILDSSRLKRALARELNISEKSVYGYSLGEHGGSQMIPWSSITIGGKSLLELMKEKPETYGKLDLDKILEETRFSGYTVLKGKGCTEFGISSGVVDIVKSIYHDEKRILTVSTYLDGEYGQFGLHTSVPAIIGKNGVEEIIELNLLPKEKEMFDESCRIIKEYISLADLL